jgi:hypothetical protein
MSAGAKFIEAVRLKNFGRTIAHDGLFFFVVQGKNAYVYNFDFQYLGRLSLTQSLLALSFDTRFGCFWAINEKGAVVKLNRRFEKIGELDFDCTKPRGLSYSCAFDTLLLGCGKEIIEICKHGKQRSIYRGCRVENVLSIPPYYAILDDSDCDQCVRFYGPDGILAAQIPILSRHKALDILFHPKKNQLLILCENGVLLKHAMPCLEVCICNYEFDRPCGNEICQWVMENLVHEEEGA